MDRDTESLFHELADLSEEGRREYFGRNAVSDEMRAEIESLLRHDGRQPFGWKAHFGAGAPEWLRPDGGPTENSACGPYRLVRLLGRGGMAAVYLAQRTDGEIEH